MPHPLVSICIPSYQQPGFIQRLLDSILIQSYQPIEVLISDDSPGEDIKIAISAYSDKLAIRYFHNSPALKTPANWNHALDKANGDLLVLMHQDDWYADKDAIRKYVDVFLKNSEIDFVFCRSMAFDENHSAKQLSLHRRILKNLKSNPIDLLKGNVIGPPGNLMVKKNIPVRYNLPYIWLVDIEYYIRLLKQTNKFYFLDEPLVNVGLHEDQASTYIHKNKEIILQENILISSSLSHSEFGDWLIYDHYWRLLRNHQVRNEKDLVNAGLDISKLPAEIKGMIRMQKRIPSSVLSLGVFSKLFMWMSYWIRPR